MLNLLFIDDQSDSIETVRNLIRKEREDIKCEFSVFDDAHEKIESLRPDIIILDLLAGGLSAEPEPEGLRTYEVIWEHYFCPVVVYSARPDIHSEKSLPHPFVKIVQKGKGSERKVLQILDEFQPHISALREAEKHVRDSLVYSMREVAPYAFKISTDDTQRREIIKRSGRRRLAALMDELSKDGTNLASWEQYLYPPVNTDIMLGDILRKVDGSVDDPQSFRIVLTPSCDLVSSRGRVPKVANVLVSKCASMKKGLDITSLKDIKTKKLKDRLVNTVLTHGYYEAMIPFPGMKDIIATMAANLRDLEFIPIEDIGNSKKPFLRIASVDSPFRELIAWAYLHTACRPGLPDRDYDSWRDEIIATL